MHPHQNLLIKGAEIITEDGNLRLVDVKIQGDQIIGIGTNLVLVDLQNSPPVLRENLATKCGWSPFEGCNLKGWPMITIVGGQIVWQNGQLNTDVRGKALHYNF